MCKTCQKPCSNIIEHIKKVHGFSASYIKDSLKTNSNSYKNSFEEIKVVLEFIFMTQMGIQLKFTLSKPSEY